MSEISDWQRRIGRCQDEMIAPRPRIMKRIRDQHPDIQCARSLSGLKNRSENPAGRGQILTILPVNSYSIDQKIGEIWTGQMDLQPISFKSDRLLGHPAHSALNDSALAASGMWRVAWLEFCVVSSTFISVRIDPNFG
jgi:hypothetical protein